MAPVAFDSNTPSGKSPKKAKKPTRRVNPPVVTGPTKYTPPSWAAASKPVKAPKAETKSVYTPPPSYARGPKKQPAEQLYNNSRLNPVIPSSDKSDFLQGPQKTLKSPETLSGSDALSKLLDFNKFKKATTSDTPYFDKSAEDDNTVEGKAAFDRLLSTSQDNLAEPEEARQTLMDFLSTVRPDNYDPEYGGLLMPEKIKHKRGDVNASLRPHWDEEMIAGILDDFKEGFPSQRESALNGILYDQLRDQEQWTKRRTLDRAFDTQEVLKRASNKAYDGDFDYLQEQLEKDPDLLEFNAYHKDYTKDQNDVLAEWEKVRKTIADPYMKRALASRMDNLKDHYQKIRSYYNKSRHITRDAIERYEAKYNESVEFNDAEDTAGPAVPDMGKEAADRQKIADLVGEHGDGDQTWAKFYGGEKAEKQVIRKQRRHIAKKLGVKELPTVKEMLAVKVSSGELDPTDEAEVEAWVERFKNPTHPDTRAMLYGFARTVNKKLDDEKDGLSFVNGPIEKYIKSEEERAKGNAKAAQEKADKESDDEADFAHQEGFWEGTGDVVEDYADHLSRGISAPFVGAKNLVTGDDRSVGGVTGAKHVQDPNALGAMGWTIDKLSRANYAVAGSVDAWNSLDQDPDKSSSWTDMFNPMSNPITNPLGWFGTIQGADVLAPVDDVLKNPKQLGKVGKAGYNQFFRGSDLPGLDKDTVPTTFAHVIANNGLRDEDDNLYDQSWYHHTAGFLLDVGTDPLNLVGVGIVDDSIKLPARISKAAREVEDANESAVDSAAFLREIFSGSRGPAADKAYSTQQALGRLGDESEHGVAQVTDTKLVPFRFTVEKGNQPYSARANLAPSINIPKFHEGFAATRQSINNELRELDALKKNLANSNGVEHLQEQMNDIAYELDFAPVALPEVRVQKLMARTSVPVKVKGVEGLHLDNAGGKFWQRVLGPLMDSDVVRAWPGNTSTTKFAEYTDANGQKRLTSRAAKTKSAIESQERNLDAASYYDVDPNIAPGLTSKWEQAIDEGYDIDEATGKPSVWQEDDVEGFLEAGAPGLLTPDFDVVGEFASAGGVPKAEFPWDQKDILKALHYGPKMLEESDDVTRQAMIVARQRIKDSKGKLDKATDPKVRAAAYKSLAMAYSSASEHTLNGAFRYLDTLRSQRMTASPTPRGESNVETLDEVISAASAEMEKSYGQIDDEGGYLGGFEGTEHEIPIQNGTYEDFDFTNKTLDQIIAEQGTQNFSSRSKQMEAIIDEARKQKAELTATDASKVTALTPAEAYQVERMLPHGSQFRNTDGSINIEKVSKHLKPRTGGNIAGMKVEYELEIPTPPKGMDQEAFSQTSRWATYRRETAFLDNVANFVEDRADHFFRQEKTKAVHAKVTQSTDEVVDDELKTFWFNKDGKKTGPAERKLGPRPTSMKDRLPNYTANRNKGKALIEEESEVFLKDENLTSLGVEKTSRPGKVTRGQQEIKDNLKQLQRNWDNQAARAREFDVKNFKELIESKKDFVTEFKLPAKTTSAVYQTAFKLAVDEAGADLNKGIIRQTSSNARLPVGDVTAHLQKQLNDEIKYESLQLQIEKAQATTADELANVERKRKALIRKRIDMYGKIKRIKMEADIVRRTTVKRVHEDQILQVANSPERMTGKMVQVRILGMKKNLQFTNGIFEGAESASKLVPLKVRTAYSENMVRPTKQLSQKESIVIRARHESKTPVIIKATLSNLHDAMHSITEPVRKSMAYAVRRDIPYGGKSGQQFEAVKAEIDDVMRIINGGHDHYVFKRPGEVTGKALDIDEITKFLSEGYNFDQKVLYRVRESRLRQEGTRKKKTASGPAVGTAEDWAAVEQKFATTDWVTVNNEAMPTGPQIDFIKSLGGDPNVINNTMSRQEASDYIDFLKTQKTKNTEKGDPFSPIPEARDEFTYGDLMEAIKYNGAAKDIDDPFRFVWAMRLAADQAQAYKNSLYTMGETFGVRHSKSHNKQKVLRTLQNKHGWFESKEVPGYFFPAEMKQELETLLGFMKPGKQSNAVAKLLDQGLGYWKQGMTIYNPAYYTRNGIGEMMVSALDGVTHPKYYRMAYRVSRYLKKTDTDLSDLITKFSALDGTIPVDVAKANEVLFNLKGGQKVRIEDVLGWYVDMGLKSTFANTDIGKGVRSLSNASLTSNKVRRGVAAANNKVHEAGEGFEDYLRMAHFIHAMQNSSKGTMKEAAEYAATRVVRSHFDYTDFSKFEKTVMLRVFPFFKWIRRGAPLMLSHLFLTPGKMAALPKALNATSNMGIDPLNAFNDDPVMSTNDIHEDQNGHLPNYSGIAPGWVRDLFAYAMQPNEDDEYANFMRITTPQIDGLSAVMSFAQDFDEKGLRAGLGDTAAYPLLNPLIKMGAELAQNKGMDPDFPYEIYGGEYNENLGIDNKEAVGTYVARNASPHLAFLSKLSKQGKLGPLSVTKDGYESQSDALRSLTSFLTGIGFYQGGQGALPDENGSAPATLTPPPVGPYSLEQLPMFPGRAGVAKGKSGSISGGLKTPAGTTTGSVDATAASGWIENKYPDFPTGSGWIPNKYGPPGGSGGYGGYSGGYSGSSGAPQDFDLLALLRKLREAVDQGNVTDLERFEQ